MIKEHVTSQDVVELLNELLVLDPEGITRFIFNRTKVNQAIADHPTVQVHAYENYPGDPNPSLGPLGFLNGLFGTRKTGGGILGVIVNNKTYPYTIEKFVVIQEIPDAVTS